MRPFPPEASAAWLPPPLLRLLPGGAIQFPKNLAGRVHFCRTALFDDVHVRLDSSTHGSSVESL
jgi:hypothetical protein